MRKIRLDDSCLNHLTNIPVGCTRKSSCIHTFWEITYQKYYVFWCQGVRTHLTQLVCYATGWFRKMSNEPYFSSSGRPEADILHIWAKWKAFYQKTRFAWLRLRCVCATDWRKSTLMSISPIIILWVTHINNRGNKMYICNLLSSVDVAKRWFRTVTGGLMLTL